MSPALLVAVFLAGFAAGLFANWRRQQRQAEVIDWHGETNDMRRSAELRMDGHFMRTGENPVALFDQDAQP